MFRRFEKSIRLPLTAMAGVLMMAMSGVLPGQAPAPVAPAQFDPSDVYFQGFLATRTAEQLEAAGDFIGAMEKLQKARQLFETVGKYYPEWKPAMVKMRTEKTDEAIRTVKAKSEAQLAKNRNQVAELEGGIRKSGKPVDTTDVVPNRPGILEVDPLVARKLKDAENEVKRLKAQNENNASQLSRTQSNAAEELRAAQTNMEALRKRVESAPAEKEMLTRKLNEAQNEVQRLKRLNEQSAQMANQAQGTMASELRAAQANMEELRKRLESVPAEKERLLRNLNEAQDEVKRLRALNEQTSSMASRTQGSMSADLKAAQANVEALRKQLAAAPLQKDMVALNKRIETLEQERLAMQMALEQSKGAHTEALAKIASLEAERKVMEGRFAELQQKQADLERNIKSERTVANSVVSGQRRQLEAMEKQLAAKNDELAKANDRIRGLMNELQESRDAFAQLRDERDSLLQEKEQMSALLKLNEASRVQDLIEQNMALAKNLREANEKVDRMNRESNADKDAINMAQRDLAIAKAQINRLHQDRKEQEKRLAELEARLKNEEASLAQGKTDADPAEVEVLRDIIRRQLRKQERQRQARELLVTAAKDMGAKDPSISQAVELLDGQEFALTPEEQKMLAGGKQVDGEFVSPFARDRATVLKATEALERDIEVFERTAEKSFVSGRLVPTRELYQMILEQYPNHTPSLCRLGVVYLKLDQPSEAVDSFRRAVEMDPSNPYAHRMLGFGLMKMGDLAAAEQAGRKAVELAPNDAKSQLLLGILCYRVKRVSEAESFFKAAISADPMISEAYFNLALICSRDGRKERAKEYYQQALERGAAPDQDLERKIDQS